MAKKTEEKTKTEEKAKTEEDPKASDEAAGSEQAKRNVEDKLDDFATRFSKAMTDGVKRMEDAFDKGVKAVRDNPNVASGKVRGFFTSSSSGSILVIVGFVWFFYAVGLLGQPVFPILMILLGIYLMYKYRNQ